MEENINIKFDEKTYEKLFHELFDEVTNQYHLKIKKVNGTMMEIVGDTFSLLIAYDTDTSWIYYTDKETEKTYLLSNYINVNSETIDMDDLPKIDIISKSIQRTLMIQSRVLQRKFRNLLEGKLEWFSEYKNSKFFYEIKKPI